MMNVLTGQSAPRGLLFGLFVTGTVIALLTPLRELFGMALHSELYSHILLIPLISGYLVYMKREVFGAMGYSLVRGAAVISVAVALYLLAVSQQEGLSRNDYLSAVMLSAVTAWIGGFILIFGTKVFRGVLFPLLFLLFMVPLPEALAYGLITLFQRGSAELVDWLFRLLGLSYLREGVTFQLPTITIEVARECSGIRSSLVLIIMGVLMTCLFLRRAWARGVLFLFILPVAILKNAIRIITLTLLAIYVDESILTSGMLHRQGGIVFFLIALGILGLILLGLRRLEKGSGAENSG